ncbi:polysaccharide deacetylase family protein [Nitrospira sp. M1]
MSIKNSLYALAKHTKLFALSNRLTKQYLRIVCFHGFSFTDEHLFRPKLFQSPTLFEQRMRWLTHAGFRTVTLDESLALLHQGNLQGNEIVITIDDGFHSVSALAIPILQKMGLTATIYVTTYYVTHPNPIFRLAIQYLFWKTSREQVKVDDIVDAKHTVGATKGLEGEKTIQHIINHGETILDEPGRVGLAREIANRLDLDFEELVTSRRLSLMSEEEVTNLAQQNFDIQLHTHRHHLPPDSTAVKRELEDNRAVLQTITGRSLHHLCYPSGEWTPTIWPLLEKEDIHTATTCEPGLISLNTSPLAWPRFLDSETTPQIVFEAEVSGFAHLLRTMLAR